MAQGFIEVGEKATPVDHIGYDSDAVGVSQEDGSNQEAVFKEQFLINGFILPDYLIKLYPVLPDKADGYAREAEKGKGVETQVV